MKDSKLDQVLEGYKPIPMKRLFYPRGMKLSEEFINAFHREYDRLISEGLNPKTLVERVSKAMTFHINDPRKYKLLDEEKEKSEGQKQREHEEAQSGPNQGERPHWWKDKKEDAKKRKGLEEGRKKKKSEEELQKSIGNRDKKGRADESDWSARKDAWARAKRNQDHNRHDWEGDEEDRVDEGKKKKKKSRKKGGTYGMGDSHADSDGGDD